jgi:ATP adenylyltransferase
MEYIRSAVAEEPDGCFLCEALTKDDDEATLVLARGPQAFVILNAYPYNPGHLMVVPNRHESELEALNTGDLNDVDALLQRSIRALKDSSSPDGFNLGMNLGRVAGAGIPGHLHWHVVPRWNGDTSHMTVVSDTKVRPELITETYARLKPFFD